MNMKHLLVGLAGLIGVAAQASAATANLGGATLDYTDDTPLGALSYTFSSSGNVVGFAWNLPSLIAVAGDAGTSATFNLPRFTLTVNPGYTLGGPVSVFLGNLVFNEFSGADVAVSATGMLSFDGGAATPLGGTLTKTVTNTMANFAGGYFSGTQTVPFANFTTVAVTDAVLTLSVAGPGFGSILAQPQNELKFSFVANPVPLPPAVWLLASALSAMGAMSRRRV